MSVSQPCKLGILLLLTRRARWPDFFPAPRSLLARQFRTYRRGAFYSAIKFHDFLNLATDYWTFCSLCIWTLTKLLRIRLKSSFSYIFLIISYLHAIHHRQNLNFLKLFCLEDGKKCQRPSKPFWGDPILPGMTGFLHFFSSFMLWRMSAKPILSPKMTYVFSWPTNVTTY